MRDFFLRTERLGFSIWDEKDLADAMELWGDPEVTRFIVADGKMAEEQVRQRLGKEMETFKVAGVQYWPVFLLESSENIGCCGLRPYDSAKNILEMGIHLKAKYWGKGYAYEACRAVIGYGFTALGADALFAGHNPRNMVSAALLKKVGFTYTHDEFYPPTGLQHPSYLLSKLDYEAAL